MKLLDYTAKINDIIDKASNIFITAHRYLDLDALGSTIGIYEYVKSRGKRATVIINDIRKEKGVNKVLNEIKDKYVIKRSSKIKNKINENSLLIIVDTSKDYLLQDSNLLNLINNVIVIDHHDVSDNTIKKGLVIIDQDTSSTCEMITEFLYQENVTLNKQISTILLAGIVLDTNNYTIKTTKETYRASYLLAEQGASPQYVQYLLKQDIKSYVERQKVITNVKQIKNVAISTGKSTVKYRREDLAKIADALLQFDKIEASFVVGKLENNSTGISARSLGKINVGKILEKFNGGGDENEAGANIENRNLREIEKELYNIIKSLD